MTSLAQALIVLPLSHWHACRLHTVQFVLGVAVLCRRACCSRILGESLRAALKRLVGGPR